MLFSSDLKNDLAKLEEFHLLEDEMSKYKTLNHENINWDKVYEYSEIILKNHSLNLKICNYLLLSCFYSNKEKYFHQLLLLLKHLEQLLNQDNDFLHTQKKKIKNLIDNFLNEYNKTQPSLAFDITKDFNEIFAKLEQILHCQFLKLKLSDKTPVILEPVKQELKTQNQSTHSLNEREYKAFYQNLAFELLDEDENNLNAYAIFTQAMWGKIKNLPQNSNNITRLRYPDLNLILALQEEKENKKEHIKYFMSNLILNPFWLEGMKLFCEFLDKNKKTAASKILISLTHDFINKFEGINKLCFETGQMLCKEEIINYFTRLNIKEKKPIWQDNQIQKVQKDLEQILIDIDNANINNSLMNNIHSLLEIAKVFENKGMKKNAKIFYLYLVELMEKTLLKDYLLEEYENAKEKVK
ncbi:type VI secretion system domain-containing protein [Campylobacter sp. US33a]|uniref:Type VI secretion system domain-containing protein n=1 Tax=Campylobacter sp. CCS1377 TaxID=3158229 RepID=A0AAU7E8Z4_9BACT|nr:type VI secretion system domain-containing protein [Campylobacter sp. US33a]MCW1360957.1 type VI secretion system domain-containing protein [Campylobacter jejuni]TEY00219.1 nucleobase:cation symporter [Campylobacter sp. US33a]